MLPSPDILNDFQPGRFVLSNLAAKRAKQLREGAPPLVQIDSNHPLTIALAEIAAGKIKAIMPSPEADSFEMPDAAVLVEETVPAELGMLLPALDETEAALVSGTVLGEDEHEVEVDEHEHEPDTLSLSDLVGEEEDHEEVAAPADDDTLSLTDIAEQESQEEEDEPE
jgi:DNA-directed RNA polymerase subunit omega